MVQYVNILFKRGNSIVKKIVLFLFLSLSIFADSKIAVAPYLGFASYDSNTSDKDTLIGMYSIMIEDTYSIEFSIESRTLTYTDTTKLKQINLATSYKAKLKNNIKLNTLFHYISSNQDQSDGTIITLFGAEKKYKNNLELGLQASASFYNLDSLAKKIFQIKPTIEFDYGHKSSKWGALHPKISFYYIKPSAENVTTLENSYFSTELELTHINSTFINKASIWFGEQLYAVRDNGFTIYNLNELHTKGWSISSRYKIDNNLGAKLSYTNENYQTFSAATLGTKEEKMSRILLVADFSF